MRLERLFQQWAPGSVQQRALSQGKCMELSSCKTSLERRLRIFVVAMPVYVIVVLLVYFMSLQPTPSLQEATTFVCLAFIPLVEGLVWLFDVLLNSIPEPKRSQYEKRVQYFKIGTRLLSVSLLIGGMLVWLK